MYLNTVKITCCPLLNGSVQNYAIESPLVLVSIILQWVSIPAAGNQSVGFLIHDKLDLRRHFVFSSR